MLSAKTPTNVIKLKKENNRERSFLMNVEELARYKNMSAEEIDRKIVPDIEDIKVFFRDGDSSFSLEK